MLDIGYQDLDRTDVDAVNADVLAHFSPGFPRTDFVEIIQNSVWPE